MSYTYAIRPNPNIHGGGWNLHLFENGEAAGLVDFPATEYENAHIDAMKAAFLRAEAEANLWIKGRKVYKRRMRLVVHPVLALLLCLVVVISSYNILKYAL